MLDSLPEAEQAALKFLDFSVGQKDRAFVVSFDNEPYLLSKLTGRKDKLVRSLVGAARRRLHGALRRHHLRALPVHRREGEEGRWSS